jgi:hypothetical protein
MIVCLHTIKEILNSFHYLHSAQVLTFPRGTEKSTILEANIFNLLIVYFFLSIFIEDGNKIYLIITFQEYLKTNLN